MAVLASDDFAGAGTSSIGGRTLNNALGGTGTRTWGSIATVNFLGDGAGGVARAASPTANNHSSVSGANKVRIKMDPAGGTSAAYVSLRRADLSSGNGTAVVCQLTTSQTSLQIREYTGAGFTTRATATVTAPGAVFYLEIEVDAANTDVIGRILNSDLSVRNTVTWGYTTIPSGDFCGFGFGNAGSTGLFDDFVVEDGAGSAQDLDPPLVTNTQTFYAPTVENGTPLALLPPLLTNSQTFYAPTLAQPGVTAAYVLANTAPVDGNVAGAMYEVAGLVSPTDYMTYSTVSGPTPSGGTLIAGIAGDFEYTGGEPAIWVIQIKINGVDYFETTTVYLYDQLSASLLPSLLTNSQTFYAPTVAGGGAIALLPSLFSNTQTFYRPTITGGIPAPTPGSDSRPGQEAMYSCIRPTMREAIK